LDDGTATSSSSTATSTTANMEQSLWETNPGKERRWLGLLLWFGCCGLVVVVWLLFCCFVVLLCCCVVVLLCCCFVVLLFCCFVLRLLWFGCCGSVVVVLLLFSSVVVVLFLTQSLLLVFPPSLSFPRLLSSARCREQVDAIEPIPRG
jgi:hypothetical protein